MNLRWILLFATIAEEGSFTRAAAKLNIAQPWLSAQMRKLEYELNVQLLVRQSAGVQVTPEGEALLPYAAQLAEAARMFRQVARTVGDTQSKTVRIGSHVPMLDIAPLRPINREFARNYFNFSLTSKVAGTPDLLQGLAESEFELVAVLGQLADIQQDWESIELGPVQLYLLAPASLGLRSIDHLEGQVIQTPPAGWNPGLIEAAAAQLKGAGAKLRAVAEFDRRAMEHSVRVHESIVLMIDDAQADYASDARLDVIPIGDIGAKHLLVRVAGRELGRGAERYWSLAKTRSR